MNSGWSLKQARNGIVVLDSAGEMDLFLLG
jgi:hypothetical protein